MGFAGRAELLSDIRTCISSLGQNGSAIRFYQASAGLGKTALLDQAALLGIESGLMVLRAGGREGLDAPPFWIIGEILFALVERLQNGNSERMDELILQERIGVALALPTLADGDAQQRLSHLDFRRQLQAVEVLTRRMLRLATEAHQVVVVLDDLHRSDEHSLRVLARTITQDDLGPMLWIAGLRPVPAGDAAVLEDLAYQVDNRTNGSVTVLEPLDPSETRELVTSFMPDAGDEQIACVVEQSGGHPLIALWMSRGSLSVELFARARLGTLGSDETEAIYAMSLLGLEFDSRIFGLITGRDQELLKRLCDDLLLAESGVDQFRVFHDILRECLVDLIPKEQKRELHSRIGHALSANGDIYGTFTQRATAEHLLRGASDADKLAGVQYGLAAAREAGRRGAWVDAYELYRLMERQAIDLVDPLTRADIENGIGRSIVLKPVEFPLYYESAGYISRAFQVFVKYQAVERLTDIDTLVPWLPPSLEDVETALSVVPEDHPRRGIAEYLAGVGLIHVQKRRLAILESAREKLRDRGFAHLEPLAVVELADSHYRHRNLETARELISWAFAHGARHDHGALGIRARLAASMIWRRLGEPLKGEAFLDEALAMWPEVRGVDSNALEDIWTFKYRSALARADWDAVFSGPEPESAWTARPLIVACYLTDQLEAGDRHLKRMIPGITRDPEAGPWISGMCAAAVTVRVMASGATDYLDDAVAWVRKLIPLYTTDIGGWDKEFFLGRLWNIAASVGYCTNDRAMLELAASGMERLPDDVLGRHIELRGMGLCAWGLGDRVAALRHFTQADTWCDTYGDITTRTWNLADLAQIHHELGHDIEATRTAEAALRMSRQHGLRAIERRLLNEAPQSDRLRRLTRREHQVLSLVAEGLADKEVGARLSISTHTASNHVRHILEKLHCSNRAEAAALAAKDDLG